MDETSNPKIQVTHINIRQSISYMLSKIITIELVFSFLVILSHTIILNLPLVDLELIKNSVFVLPIFILLVIAKSFITFLIIMEWLNDYYEITLEEIIHRKGFIFKTETNCKISQIAFIEINQDALGRVFNYGTIRLLSQRRYQFLDMYLIHNPLRYAQIIKELNPNIVESNDLFEINIIESTPTIS